MHKTTAAISLLLLTTAPGLSQHPGNNADHALLPSTTRSVSTVAENGDLGPSGVAFVPDDFPTGSGPLQHGDILVSNFNNSSNMDGLGSTIVRIPQSGDPSTFFRPNEHRGLSMALGILRFGFVVVGNFPSADGTLHTATAGSLLIIDNQGVEHQNITDPGIQGPWDLALVDFGDHAIVFLSNALTGTISRLELSVSATGVSVASSKTIASGYVHREEPETYERQQAFVVSPAGLVYDKAADVLYVASTGDNTVFAISGASKRTDDQGTGHIVYQDKVHLHGPLAMAEAPNGHLLVSNSDGINSDLSQPSEIVEFTKSGIFVKQFSVDPLQGGAVGLATRASGDIATLAAVDDNDNANNITIWQLDLP